MGHLAQPAHAPRGHELRRGLCAAACGRCRLFRESKWAHGAVGRELWLQFRPGPHKLAAYPARHAERCMARVRGLLGCSVAAGLGRATGRAERRAA